MKSDSNRPSPDWLARRDRANRTHGDRRPSYREWQRDRLLMDWFGGVMAPDQLAELRGPTKMAADFVDDILADVDRSGAVLLGRLCEAWPGLVGTDIANVSSPVRLENGVLWIGITNTTWRYVLEQQFRGNLLKMIQNASDGQVRQIRLVPAGAASSSTQFNKRNRPPQ